MLESKNSCANYLTKFCVDLDVIFYAVEACWSDHPHIIFCPMNIQGKLNFGGFIEKKKQWLAFILV